MFAQIFQSELLPYRTPDELYGIPSGSGLGSLYHPELVTPPRIYAEEIYSLIGLFVNREKTANSDFTIHLLGTTNWIYWPGYNFTDWRFDGNGAFVDRRDGLTGSLYDYQIHQARDGSLWRVSILGSFFEVDTVTFEEIEDSRQEASKYGAITLDCPLVDRAQNIVLLKTNNENNNSIGVYNFTSGALIRRIRVSGDPVQIVAEDERRCYVVNSNHILNLVDYSTGAVLSTLRAPNIEAGALGTLFAWDRFLRRLLVFTWRPNAIDGACLSSIGGYFPRPLAVGLTKPIPLWPLRAGRSVPCLARAYGDAGEAIPGLTIEPAIDGDANIIGAPPATDNDGEAIITIACTDAGTSTLDLTAIA